MNIYSYIIILLLVLRLIHNCYGQPIPALPNVLLTLSAQIRNATDPSQDPIQLSESVPGCVTGACSASVSLSIEDGLVEGVSYIVEVGAVNRYGESAVSGNSEPFIFGDAGVCVCACVHNNASCHVCNLCLIIFINPTLPVIYAIASGKVVI